MPKYQVTVTRDITESVTFTVEAEDDGDAHELAIERALAAGRMVEPALVYERDECGCSAPYVTGEPEEVNND